MEGVAIGRDAEGSFSAPQEEWSCPALMRSMFSFKRPFFRKPMGFSSRISGTVDAINVFEDGDLNRPACLP